MKNKVLLLTFVIFSFTSVTAFAQSVTVGGQLGFASPNGGHFKDSNGEKMASGGIAIDVDILYHPEQMDGKLGLGLTLNSSFLFGASTSGAFEIGMYGLSLYGVKAHYKFFPSKVSPYVALSTGLSQFSTPEISTIDGDLIAEGSRYSSFGLRPELGLNLGGFILSAAYYVPMNYTVFDEKASAGALQISLGFRIKAY